MQTAILNSSLATEFKFFGKASSLLKQKHNCTNYKLCINNFEEKKLDVKGYTI
jgi:hypothetical protein